MTSTEEIKRYLSQNQAYRELKIVDKWNCAALSLKDIYELVKRAEQKGKMSYLKKSNFDKYGLEI